MELDRIDRPATTWAWTQVSSPNLRFQGLALTFLGLAELADRALSSPNGYAFSTTDEVARLTGQDSVDVRDHLLKLARCGLAVQAPEVSGWRVSEEAFDNPVHPDHPCAKCPNPARFVVVFKDDPTDPHDLCGPCAGHAVALAEVASITPGEAVWGHVPEAARA